MYKIHRLPGKYKCCASQYQNQGSVKTGVDEQNLNWKRCNNTVLPAQLQLNLCFFSCLWERDSRPGLRQDLQLFQIKQLPTIRGSRRVRELGSGQERRPDKREITHQKSSEWQLEEKASWRACEWRWNDRWWLAVRRLNPQRSPDGLQGTENDTEEDFLSVPNSLKISKQFERKLFAAAELTAQPVSWHIESRHVADNFIPKTGGDFKASKDARCFVLGWEQRAARGKEKLNKPQELNISVKLIKLQWTGETRRHYKIRVYEKQFGTFYRQKVRRKYQYWPKKKSCYSNKIYISPETKTILCGKMYNSLLVKSGSCIRKYTRKYE